MTTTAIIMLVVSGTIIWGGLIASALALRARPEVASYPPGGADEPGFTDEGMRRDT